MKHFFTFLNLPLSLKQFEYSETFRIDEMLLQSTNINIQRIHKTIKISKYRMIATEAAHSGSLLWRLQ